MSHDELRVPRRAPADRRATRASRSTRCSTRSRTRSSPRTSGCPHAAEEAVVTIDSDSGEIRVYGQELDEDGNVVREWDDTPSDFGRIAAQAAKQVILQRIREAERDRKYEEYAGREGDIVTGIIQQSDNRYTLLDLGKVEALLPQAEQVPYERYDHGARLKAYIVEVRKTSKGPQIVVSRSHPGLIKRLFELEVPEISNGVVEIKACAREPGHRTKIAVWSNDPNVDPVGACVGARGARVRMVTNELRGEKVDIVPYLGRPGRVRRPRAAAGKVKEVRLDEETGTATVIVHDYQLSLAIGKEGQNARLAARLTGWRIDIKSETQLAEEESATTPPATGPRASGSRARAARWSSSPQVVVTPSRWSSGRRAARSPATSLRRVRCPAHRPLPSLLLTARRRPLRQRRRGSRQAVPRSLRPTARRSRRRALPRSPRSPSRRPRTAWWRRARRRSWRRPLRRLRPIGRTASGRCGRWPDPHLCGLPAPGRSSTARAGGRRGRAPGRRPWAARPGRLALRRLARLPGARAAQECVRPGAPAPGLGGRARGASPYAGARARRR